MIFTSHHNLATELALSIIAASPRLKVRVRVRIEVKVIGLVLPPTTIAATGPASSMIAASLSPLLVVNQESSSGKNGAPILAQARHATAYKHSGGIKFR
jgi:hypothetical protein